MKKYVHENTSLIKPLSKLLDADKKKNRHTRYDLSFQSSLPFISFKRAQSRNLWTFMFGLYSHGTYKYFHPAFFFCCCLCSPTWVDVPLDFLTMGVLGSRSRDWAKSGCSCSTWRDSFTPLLQKEKGEGGQRWDVFTDRGQVADKIGTKRQIGGKE